MSHTLRRLAGVLSLLAVSMALGPNLAHAGTAGVVDLPSGVRALLFVAAPGETNSTELYYEAGAVTVTDTLAGGVDAGDGCQPVITAGSRDARCATDGVQLAVLSLGDGNDVQSVPNLDRVQRACPLPLLIDGGDGNDVIVTCRDGDTVAQLGTGNDILYVGTSAGVEADLGPGDDRVGTFNGATFGPGTYSGGPGDDLLLGTPARETFNGGDGTDRVEFPHNRVDANLDGQPGDSPEGDHVGADVEVLAASVAGSVLTGNDGPNALLSGGAAVTLRGLGGDDTLIGSDYGETLEGGPGRDRLTGGFGDDVLDPGPGTDTVDADRQADDGFAAGNDTITARDGELDQIGCGIGADVAVLDSNDVADACESVDRATSGNGSAPPNAEPALAKATVKILRASRRSGLRVRVTTPTAVKVQLVARHKGRIVARGTVKTKPGRAVTAALRLKKTLPRRASLQLTVTAPGLAPRTVKTTLR
ncbi:hypothetical protein DVA67_017225 [Solirubrobacter sp. CPCC 204708]|uniref:Calcium-binding protein n=1 Tax=Solirubrobacter deserti TaxID=2282478 RepID=A0ABT4RD77_9ACTN|nr:calcium-binding protein [Solirubrobacter deserti]MBE2317727.1 hypothetical protein [Solirubrobacter deserti]MDA0136496.1 hypothetical protein [Solirubrobacter deserti]